MCFLFCRQLLHGFAFNVPNNVTVIMRLVNNSMRLIEGDHAATGSPAAAVPAELVLALACVSTVCPGSSV